MSPFSLLGGRVLRPRVFLARVHLVETGVVVSACQPSRLSNQEKLTSLEAKRPNWSDQQLGNLAPRQRAN